ncbi:MAG: MFS transporter [Bacillota bacterium]|nr:MFS transporter [Bacillota bacterium]
MRFLPKAYAAIFRCYPVLGLIGAVSFLATAGWALVIPVLPLYLAVELGIAPGTIGFIFGAYAASETLSKTPFGIIGDHLGRKPVALTGLALALCVPVLMLCARHPLHFVILQIINGLSIAAFWPTMAALTADRVAPEHRATALTIYNTSYLIALGLGPPAGIFLSHLAGSNRAALLAAAAVTGLGLLLAVMLPDRRDRRESPPVDRRRVLVAAFAGGIPAQLRFIRASRPLGALLAVSVLQMFAVGFLGPVFVLFIRQHLGFDEADISRAILVPVILVALSSIPLGRLADRIGYTRAARLAFLAGAAGILLLPVAENLWLLTAFIGLLGLAYVFGAPAWTAIASALAPTASRGTAIAALSTMQSLGFILGSPAGGYLYQIAGPAAPFYACGALLILCVLLIAVLIRLPRAAAADAETGEQRTA